MVVLATMNVKVKYIMETVKLNLLFQMDNLDIWCHLQKIAGADQIMQQTFTDALGTEVPYTVVRVQEAIKAVNELRWERLLLLLEYIEDQGEFCNNGIKLTQIIATLFVFSRKIYLFITFCNVILVQ